MDARDGTARPKAPRRPWYAEGLRFECRPDCGRCCTRHDDYAYVYLDRDDVARLAAHFEMTPPEFAARWTSKDDGHTILRMDEAEPVRELPVLAGQSEDPCAVGSARVVLPRDRRRNDRPPPRHSRPGRRQARVLTASYAHA